MIFVGVLYDKLIMLDELSTRECVITIKLSGKPDKAEIYVENCRKVLSCDDEFITLGVCGADIRISGTPLMLENFGVGGVKITGKIASVDISEKTENSSKGMVNRNEK